MPRGTQIVPWMGSSLLGLQEMIQREKGGMMWWGGGDSLELQVKDNSKNWDCDEAAQTLKLSLLIHFHLYLQTVWQFISSGVVAFHYSPF